MENNFNQEEFEKLEDIRATLENDIINFEDKIHSIINDLDNEIDSIISKIGYLHEDLLTIISNKEEENHGK